MSSGRIAWVREMRGRATLYSRRRCKRHTNRRWQCWRGCGNAGGVHRCDGDGRWGSESGRVRASLWGLAIGHACRGVTDRPQTPAGLASQLTYKPDPGILQGLGTNRSGLDRQPWIDQWTGAVRQRGEGQGEGAWAGSLQLLGHFGRRKVWVGQIGTGCVSVLTCALHTTARIGNDSLSARARACLSPTDGQERLSGEYRSRSTDTN